MTTVEPIITVKGILALILALLAFFISLYHIFLLKKQYAASNLLELWKAIRDLESEIVQLEIKFESGKTEKDDYKHQSLIRKSSILDSAELFCFLINDRIFYIYIYNRRIIKQLLKNKIKEWHDWIEEIHKNRKSDTYSEIINLYNKLYKNSD